MEELKAQHDQIRKLGAAIWGIVKQPKPEDSAEFAQLRVAMSRALTAHFQAEDQALGKTMWGTSGVPTQLLSEWEAERQKLRLLYSQHLRDWPLSEALANWNAYRMCVRERLGAAETLMKLEETAIYPLVS